MPEILDLYDKDGNRTGETIVRGTKIPEGRHVLLVSIVTVNGKGEILLTKRAPGKTYEGCWEVTGGCVQSGETAVHGAVRELSEETGIRAAADELECRGQRTGKDFIHEFYLLRKDVPLSGLTLRADETDAAEWVQPEEYLRLAEQYKTIPLGVSLLQEYYPDLFQE